MAAILCVSATAANAELTHQFKNPAFSGIGWSSHVLTIDSVEKSRRDAVESQRKAEVAAAAATGQNTPMNRFMSLFTSAVYGRLSSQLVESLFPTCAAQTTCAGKDAGVITIEGTQINWKREPNTGMLTLEVKDKDNNITKIEMPLNSIGAALAP
jgi:hypothetical protein